MASGEHFTPGVPLTGTLSFTASDVDTSQSGILLAASRSIIIIKSTEPDSSDGPDWQKLIWGKPITVNSKITIKLMRFVVSSSTWEPCITGFPNRTDIPIGSIPVNALYATLLQVGMVPIVTSVSGNAVVQWQTFIPTNIPIGNLVPGSSPNLIAVTNNAGTGVVWSSLVSLLSSLGAIIPLSSISQSGATTNQVAGWNGSQWVPTNAYTPPVPQVIDAAWVAAANWIEVYSTIQGTTIRKTRSNFINSLVDDFTNGSLGLDTIFIGWPSSNPGAANLFTIQNILDSISPTIIAEAVSQGASVYPKKFYTGLYQIPINYTAPTELLAGITHNLGAAPMSIGGRIKVTATGEVFDIQDFSFATVGIGTQPCYSFTVKADASKIYIYDGGVSGKIPAGTTAVPQKPVIIQGFTLGDYMVQLYAYL